jgi:predicted dehydrogenase
MPKNNQTTRRTFMKAATTTALAGNIKPARAAGKKIRLALLGCGKITQMNVPLLQPRIDAGDLEIVACCDLYNKRLREMAEKTGARPYRLYKEMLAKEDIDFVYIGTPDHWHAKMTMDCIAAGLDVVVEKGMTRTTDEAKTVYNAVRNSGCIFTAGSRSLRHGAYWNARDVVKTGVLGKLLWAQTSTARNYPVQDVIIPSAQPTGEEGSAGPLGTGDNNILWDEYHGPGPIRNWEPDRFFNWRWFWDYSTGLSGDLLWYNIADILLAVGPRFPLRVTATGNNHLRPLQETPDLFFSTITFEDDFYLNMMYSRISDHGWSDIIMGHEAALYFSGSHYGISGDGCILAPERRFEKDFRAKCERLGLQGEWQTFKRDVYRGPNRGTYETDALYFPGFNRPASSIDKFIDCVRDRKKMVMDETFSYQVMQTVGMSVDALKRNQVERFDPPRV